MLEKYVKPSKKYNCMQDRVAPKKPAALQCGARSPDTFLESLDYFHRFT